MDAFEQKIHALIEANILNHKSAAITKEVLQMLSDCFHELDEPLRMHLYLSIHRIMEGHQLEDNIRVMREDMINDVCHIEAQELIDQIADQIGFEINETETTYLLMHVINHLHREENLHEC